MKKTLTMALAMIPATLALGAHAAIAASVSARNCEIFVSGAVLQRGSHSSRTVDLQVTIKNERLDAPVAKVGMFVETAQLRNSFGRNDEVQRNEVELKLVGSKYRPASPIMISSGFGESVYRVSPFVETATGTRYYANAQDGGNLTLNSALTDTLLGIQADSFGQDAPFVSTLNDGLSALNPSSCR